MKVRVKVRLHEEALRENPEWSGGRREAELSAGATVDDLVIALGVPPHLVCLVAINGIRANRSSVLGDGDAVDIVPPIAGG